jgi:hypothetical protein
MGTLRKIYFVKNRVSSSWSVRAYETKDGKMIRVFDDYIDKEENISLSHTITTRICEHLGTKDLIFECL